MRLLVDGYNLCHALGLLQAKAGSPARAGPHELEKARLQLLGRLAAVCGDKDAVTVVFDAAGALPGSTADDWHQGVHILYAQSRRPRDLIVRLKLEESHLADVRPGQTVRVSSNVFNQRLYGAAEAVIQRVEPWGETGADGQRRFNAVAAVREAPFVLPLGSTCRAEIVLGQKLVYRLVLEH